MDKTRHIERTFVLIKPDAVSRKIIGVIIERFERADLKIVALKMIKANRVQLETYFPAHDRSWIEGMGQKSLETYKLRGLNPMDTFGTDDAEKIGEQILEWNFEYLSSGPLVAMIIEGIKAVSVVRKFVGDTIPARAVPGTIRGDYSTYSVDFANHDRCACKNIVHASSNLAEAEFECGVWFSPDDLCF